MNGLCRACAVMASLVIAACPVSAAPGIELKADRPITNPGDFDIVDSVHGDLRSMDHCQLPGGTEVLARRDFDTNGDIVTIRQNGAERSVSISDTTYWGTPRISMDCDPHKARWFYGHTAKGTVTAYSASGAKLWEVRLEPFNALPNKRVASADEAVGKFLITALQVRGRYILVEYTEFRVGQHFALLTTDGKPADRFGPTTFMLRTAGTQESWELLWGTSPLPSSFIPLELYTLRVAENPAGSDQPAAVLARLKLKSNPDKRIASKLKSSALMDHAVALLWAPTSKHSLDFCPITTPESARVWLGRDYDPSIASEAKRLLLSLWIALQERYTGLPDGPLNGLFQERSKTDPDLARLLSKMTPTDPAWDTAFRPKALAILEALPETRRWSSAAASTESAK